MNSKERVNAALRHIIPDRIPIDYQAKKTIDAELKSYYGINTEKELLDILGCDFYYLSVRDISQNETFLPIYTGPKLEMTESERVCPFGITFRRDVRDDKFGADEAIKGPLENATTSADILNYEWPDPNNFDFDLLLKESEEYKDKVIIGGFWSGILGDSYRMFGFENFLLNLAINPGIIKTLVNKMTDFYLELNNRFFHAMKGKMDIFFFGNDFGSQNGLLFSKEQWDDIFLENYRKLVDLAKSYEYKVMAHSCGSIVPILDRFIEVGIDIIDPVQTTAAGMEPKILKEKFGDNLVFHGAIDTQKILPFGTPEDVKKHVEDTINVLGKDGGYIMVSSNNIQNDTPVENIDIMYKTAKEFKFK